MFARNLKRLVCLLAVCMSAVLGQTLEFTTVDYPGAVGTNARAISNEGVVLGSWSDSSGNSHGFLLIDKAMVSFDCAGAVATIPRAMNSSHEAVGTSKDAAGKWAGFYVRLADPSSWTSAGAKCTRIEPKGSIGRNSGNAAFGISESGEIAGWYDDEQNKWRGYLYRDGVYLTYDMVQGAEDSPLGMSPLALSPQGDLIGHMQVTGSRMRGWVIRNGKTQFLDYPPGELNGMTCGFAGNSKGEIVGHYQRSGEMIRGLYFKDGVYATFVFPNSKRTDGQGINDNGVIVGYYVDQADKVHGFVARR
ncbi:MAG: hypothetical protein HY820_35780 [Acidobacteria bacterium]|nr:hypothetical protein [Acidobacteriota bacterium]